MSFVRWCWCCFQWFKDTKMKANHNKITREQQSVWAVSNGSKILKWKQITTIITCFNCYYCCFQWFKDTKMKANHNDEPYWCNTLWSCFQWFKDTKMKANHNVPSAISNRGLAVSNGSKILKWKQITTPNAKSYLVEGLFPMVQRY